MRLKKHSIFTSETEYSEFKNKINGLIDRKSKNSIFIQLKNIILFREDIYGFMENDKFVLWQYSWFWTGLFYPIVHGHIIRKEEKYYVKMETSLNLVGKIFCFLIIGGVTWAIVSMANLRFDNFSLIQIILSLLALFPWIITPYLIIRHFKIKFLKLIMNRLDLKNIR